MFHRAAVNSLRVSARSEYVSGLIQYTQIHQPRMEPELTTCLSCFKPYSPEEQRLQKRHVGDT